MTFLVQPCVPADAHDIATTNMSAWYEDYHWKYRWQASLEEIIKWCEERFPHLLTTERETKRHQKVVDVATGEVVGYARWLLPTKLAEKNVWPEAQAAEPNTRDVDLFAKKWNIASPKLRSEEMNMYRSRPLEETDERIRKMGPFLVLDYLTVKPAFKGQGVATMLVKSGIKIADAYHQRAHVMSSVAGLRLYEKQGFKIVETTSIDYSQFGATEPLVHHFMVREPVSSKV